VVARAELAGREFAKITMSVRKLEREMERDKAAVSSGTLTSKAIGKSNKRLQKNSSKICSLALENEEWRKFVRERRSSSVFVFYYSIVDTLT